MRRRAGIIGLVVLLLLPVATLALLVQSGQAASLSQSQLTAELQARGAAALAWISGRGLPLGSGGLGLSVGWLCGSARMRSRLRQRSLLLINRSGPDMPFMEGVRHVCHHGEQLRAELPSASAAELLLSAARAGQLSLWRRTPADLAYRISRRQLRNLTRANPAAPPSSSELAALGPLSLIRCEVEALWPKQHAIEVRSR
jgi:hypothetical protein